MWDDETPAKPPEHRRRFEEMVERYYEDLWTYSAYLMGGRTGDAEDILQEAFLAVFDRLAKGGGFTGDPGLWLRGVVRNLVRQWWRDKKRVPAVAVEEFMNLAEATDSSLDASLQDELMDALTLCIQQLEEPERRLVSKRYQGDFDADEAARSTGVNVKTVYVRLFRIRSWLKECVEKHVNAWGRT